MDEADPFLPGNRLLGLFGSRPSGVSPYLHTDAEYRQQDESSSSRGNGLGCLVCLPYKKGVLESAIANTGPSAAAAAAVKTVQLKSLSSRADYTCEFHLRGSQLALDLRNANFEPDKTIDLIIWMM